MIIKPLGGLCNFLRVIFSCYSCALEKNEKLIVIWIKTNQCPGYFLDYFEPIDNIIFEYNENSNYEIDYIGSSYYLHYSCNYSNVNLLPEIKNTINEKITILNNYIAVHIRRTDHVQYAKGINAYISDDEFYAFIDNKCLNKNLYIATDNEDTYKLFKDKYSKLVKFEYHEVNNNELRKTSLKDAIIDIYICANADNFMGTNCSSFSGLICELKRIIQVSSKTK